MSLDAATMQQIVSAAPSFCTSAEVDEYGVAPSSVFSSGLARTMPWEAKKAVNDPGPSRYDISNHRSIGSGCCRHSTQSAAFASSSNRFPKPRPAAGDADASSPLDQGMHADQGMHVTTPQRLSASFASSSRRQRTPSSQTPGPRYFPRHASQVGEFTNSARTAISAGLASTLERRLPFEVGGMHSSDLQTPGPARYSPRPAEDFRGRGKGPGQPRSGVPHKGAASLRYTSPRFSNGHYHEVPGPGAYDAGASDRRTLASAYSTAHKLPNSTEERRLQFDIRTTPAADAYSPRASARGVGELALAALHTPSAAFASSSERLRTQCTASPGPGSYQPVDGKATASAVAVLPAPRGIRRSASFGSTSRRFRERCSTVPGPGAYASRDVLASPRRAAQQVSASFASTSERIQLPANPMHALVPGPGGYEHSNPVADYTRPLRRSASFASSSERLRAPRHANPPPGAYNPKKSSRGRALSSATQRYSITRLAS